MSITVSQWMRMQLIEEEDIEFIETLILSSSTANSGQISPGVLADKINTDFPRKYVKLSDDINFEEFKNNILTNNINLDVRQLLIRYLDQGLCKDLCKKFLNQSYF